MVDNESSRYGERSPVLVAVPGCRRNKRWDEKDQGERTARGTAELTEHVRVGGYRVERRDDRGM